MTQILGRYPNVLGSYNHINPIPRNRWLPNGDSYITAPNSVPMTGLVTRLVFKDPYIDLSTMVGSSNFLIYQGIATKRDLTVVILKFGGVTFYYKDVFYEALTSAEFFSEYPGGVITSEFSLEANETLGTYTFYNGDVAVKSAALTPVPAYVQTGGLIFIGAQPISDDIGDTNRGSKKMASVGWRIGNIVINVDDADAFELIMPLGTETNIPETIQGNDGTLRQGTEDGTDWLAAIEGTVDPFTFTPSSVIDVNPAQFIETNVITVNGSPGRVLASIVDGEFSVDASSFSSAPRDVYIGQSIKARLLSPAIDGESLTLTMTIGEESNTFTATTLIAVGLDPFVFTPASVSGVDINTVENTNIITPTGVGGPFGISVNTGSEYRLSSNPTWTSDAGTFTLGETVEMRVTVGGNYAPFVYTGTLTIDTRTASFAVNTIAEPAQIFPFAFDPNFANDVALGINVESPTIVPTGVTGTFDISVVNGEYNVDDGGWVSSDSTFTLGSNVKVRVLSSSSYGSVEVVTLTIGPENDSFIATTLEADVTPDPIFFTTQSDILLAATNVTSNTQTIAGIDIPIGFTVTGGEYSINGGGWTSATGNTLDAGDTIALRADAPSQYNTATTVSLLMAGDTYSFRFITEKDPAAPVAQLKLGVVIVGIVEL